MTDARAMPWSEARKRLEYLLETASDPDQHIYGDEIAAIELAIALGDRCAQAEQQPEGSFGYCAVCYHPLDQCSHCDGNQRAEQAEAEAALFRQRSGQLTDVEVTLRRAVVAGSALEMVQQLISDRASDRATLDRAEAECARLREELAEAREITTGDIARTVRENALRTIVQALEAQVAALTQERDALRTARLERDDMREGV